MARGAALSRYRWAAKNCCLPFKALTLHTVEVDLRQMLMPAAIAAYGLRAWLIPAPGCGVPQLRLRKIERQF
jgi:hypothetical protein